MAGMAAAAESLDFAHYASALRRQIDAALQSHTDFGPGCPPHLAEAIRHSLLAPGKRLRPMLVLMACQACGYDSSRAIAAACSVEMIHSYSLVHDDLPAMDDDDLRRGQPTLHKAYDEWTAILAGDALATLAFEILAEPRAPTDGKVRARLVLGLAQAAGRAGMVGGQCLDLAAEKLAAAPPPTVEEIERLQAMKTGALIGFSAEAGAILAQAEAGARAALRRYGEALGLAFQIADDLLDAEGDAAVLGKRVAKDAPAGKATFVSLVGREAARHRLNEAERQAIGALDLFGKRADVLREAAAFVSRRRH